jgi:hypothetical protein
VSGRAHRSTAYAELISGLLEARHDAASARFDAEVTSAEADGRIDERTARVLRWWQRESVRAVVDHARAVIPPALGAIDEADEAAVRQNDDAAQAWERAITRALPVLGVLAGVREDVAEEKADKARAEKPERGEPSHAPAWRIPAARDAGETSEEPRRRLIVAGLSRLPGESAEPRTITLTQPQAAQSTMTHPDLAGPEMDTRPEIEN